MQSTIVALATPPGLGALHIIRMSGPDAFEIINAVSADKVEKTTDRLQITFLKSRNDSYIDQVVLLKFYAPNSYTGEDCIEISCHGNGLISKLIIDELVKHGAKHAGRGEFTKRAFLNGKITLDQAISIGNLFKSESESDIYSSIQEIRGATVKVIDKYLEILLNLINECELNIDYPTEIFDDSEAFLNIVRSKIQDIYKKLNVLYLRSKKQKLSNFRVVFIGKPNAGKSSLINYLVGKDRVIVSDKSGTTTDSIEVDYCFDKYILTMVDTAGIEEIKELSNYDYAKKTKQELDNSDFLVYLVSSEDLISGIEDSFWSDQIKDRDYIKVITKSDLSKEKLKGSISVKNSDIKYLEDKLLEHLKSNYSLISIKSADNINHLGNSVSELSKALNFELPIDLISEHLKSAYDHLSRILKKPMSSEDKINKMFDDFCVGK